MGTQKFRVPWPERVRERLKITKGGKCAGEARGRGKGLTEAVNSWSPSLSMEAVPSELPGAGGGGRQHLCRAPSAGFSPRVPVNLPEPPATTDSS